MDPGLIFRHSPTEGPGYFATFLDRHGIPWTLVRIDAGDPDASRNDPDGSRNDMGAYGGPHGGW